MPMNKLHVYHATIIDTICGRSMDKNDKITILVLHCQDCVSWGNFWFGQLIIPSDLKDVVTIFFKM